MAPDVRSLSWSRNEPSRSSGSTRRRLSDMFDREKKPSGNNSRSPGRVLRDLRQLSMPRLPRSSPARRAIRSGAEKISKTFQQLRISMNSFSQRLKGPVRRRRRFENTDTPIATPQTRSRRILGRTPTKMYSPFGIDTPNVLGGEPFTPRRSKRGQNNENLEMEASENIRPVTRSMLQHFPIPQQSPSCKALLT